MRRSSPSPHGHLIGGSDSGAMNAATHRRRRPPRGAGCCLAAALLAAPAGALAEETVCRGSLGAVTVDNLRVPDGATCSLDGTTVKGTAKVETAATLRAANVRVIGNVQGENAARVRVTASRVGGSVQVEQGGGAEVSDTHVDADIQLDANDGATQRLLRNRVGGNVQVVANRGGVEITRNVIDGNLQCKENVPAPTGAGNVVHGSAEDQCSGLAGGTSGDAGPAPAPAPSPDPGDDDGRDDDADDRATVAYAGGALRAARGGRTRIRLACDGGRCAGRTWLAFKGRRLSTKAPFALQPGSRRAAAVRLNRRGQRIAKRGKRVRVVVATAAGTQRFGAKLRRR
jgi:hypothetical protein